MTDCLFCNIISKKIASDIVFEDDDILAFNDVSPQAPIHILLIPKKHIATVNELAVDDQTMMGKLINTAKIIAQQQGVDQAGYRLVINCNEQAGQTVFHLHLHLLAGRQLNWPPG